MKIPSSTPTILIVDDDDGHALLIRQNLEETGVERIQHFRDGQEFLDFCVELKQAGSGRNELYLVLLDIRMPKVDGVEVLRRLKADPELKRMPVIMLTTTDDAREVARCYELGCSVYLQKPVDYDRFAEAIQRLGLFTSLLLVPAIGQP